MKINLKQLILFSSISLLFISTRFCPEYKCVNKDDGSCASIKRYSTTSSDVEITELCKTGEYCNIPQPPNIFLIDSGSDTFFCKTEQPPKIGQVRYPGEECSSDDECIKTGSVGECNKKGKCIGKSLGETCSGHAECLVG
jgi:hypothetical protein